MAELIRSDIKTKVPTISDQELTALMEKLSELGLRDLQTVCQAGAVTLDDLKDVVPIGIARVLLRLWSEVPAPDPEVVSSTASAAPAQGRDNQQRQLGLSANSRHLQPEVDFDALGMLNVMACSEPSSKERRKVLSAASELILIKYGKNVNLHIDSWKFVALQIAKKNPAFYDPSLGKKATEKTVGVASTFMSSHIAHFLSTKASTAADSPPSKKRSNCTSERDAYGCKPIDYNCQKHTEEETKSATEDLKKEHEADPAVWNLQTIAVKMSIIFNQIHFDLNVNKLDALQAKEKYPFLFEEQCTLSYFEELTGIAAVEALNVFVRDHLRHAYNHFTRQCSSPDERKMMSIDKQMLAAEKEVRTEQPKLIAVLLMALLQFHDGTKFNPGDFIITAEESWTNEELKKNLKLPDTPIMIALGPNAMTANWFILCIDGEPVMKVRGISKALSCYFAVYYVLCVCYPPKAFLLWEFIQRAIFGMNPMEDKKSNSRGKTKKGEGKPPLSRRVAATITEIEKLSKIYNSEEL